MKLNVLQLSATEAIQHGLVVGYTPCVRLGDVLKKYRVCNSNVTNIQTVFLIWETQKGS